MLNGKNKVYLAISAPNANKAILTAMRELLTSNGYHEKAHSLTENEAIRLYKTPGYDNPVSLDRTVVNQSNNLKECPDVSDKKYDDPLSYENSCSFASSEDEYEEHLKQRQKQREEILLTDYRKLNNTGQEEERKRANELIEIPNAETISAIEELENGGGT